MSELMGKRVVITRPRAQADDFGAALSRAGAETILFPVIEIRPILDPTILDRALSRLVCYDWIVFTSMNGVKAVWERLENLGILSLPDEVKIAAIGPKTTQALQERGVAVDFMPVEYVAEAILPGLGDLRGRWVLLPRADIARPALAHGIASLDGIAHEIAAYHTLPATPDVQSIAALRQGVDVVTFTSSSTVRNFSAVVHSCGLDPRTLPGQPVFACIGPITAASAREEGFPVDIVAEEYTTQGLLDALILFFRQR